MMDKSSLSVEVFPMVLDESVDRLTDEDIRCFVGGRIEVQNRAEGYIYKGQIKDIALHREPSQGNTPDNVSLRAELGNVQKNGFEGLLPTGEWEEIGDDLYDTTLVNCTASSIGNGRICFVSQITNEMIVLFPERRDEC